MTIQSSFAERERRKRSKRGAPTPKGYQSRAPTTKTARQANSARLTSPVSALVRRATPNAAHLIHLSYYPTTGSDEVDAIAGLSHCCCIVQLTLGWPLRGLRCPRELISGSGRWRALCARQPKRMHTHRYTHSPARLCDTRSALAQSSCATPTLQHCSPDRRNGYCPLCVSLQARLVCYLCYLC